MSSTKTSEYTLKFDIGETVRFAYEHPVIKDAIVVAIIIEGNDAVMYRCAYMVSGKRYQDVFTEHELRTPTVNGKSGKRTTPRATAKKTGGT